MKAPKYTQGFVDKTGRARWYFRRSGFKRAPLPGLPWSPEFMAAYEMAVAQGAETAGASKTAAGTLNAAIVSYYTSSDWAELAPGTRVSRRAILERFREEAGTFRMASLGRTQVDLILKSRPTYHAKKNWLKTIRGLMAFAVETKLIGSDPSVGVALKRPKRKSSGFLPWGDEQIAAYRARWPLGTMARVAIELLLNIAARRGDAFTLGKQHEKHGRITWRPRKTSASTGKVLRVAIMPRLREALDAMLPTDSMTYLTNHYGRPFASSAAFGNKFAEWCLAAGLEPVVCADGRTRAYRAHGLRKASCQQLAHDGCTAPEIQAISGHATLAQLQIYIDAVDQERLAETAIAKRLAGDAASLTPAEKALERQASL